MNYMRDNDSRYEGLRQENDEIESVLGYKTIEHFDRFYDRIVPSIDVPNLGDEELVAFYKLAQRNLSTRIYHRDNPVALEKDRQQASYEQQDKNVTPRFEFLGKLGAELDKPERRNRLKEKGIPFPLTMDKKVFFSDIHNRKVIDVDPDETKLE